MVDGNEEDKALELELELQLQEQKESLTVVNEALISDSTNEELLSVREELVLAIKDAEEGLLHLKRSRLLHETDSLLSNQAYQPTIQDVEVAPIEAMHVEEVPTHFEVQPFEMKSFPIGSKCRFRHTDGRWYNGHIIGLEGDSSARISFLMPTSENMLMCKFFLQKRCRFGSNCRLSHGVDIPVSSLKHHVPTIWQQSLVGSSIWALSNSNAVGIWRRAELESWDNESRLGNVIFCDDGSSAKVGSDALSLSEYAQMSEEEEEDESSSEGLGTSEDEEDPENGMGTQGLGFLEATILQRGVQTETAIFSKWEHHTRGIASKMMASMGYREGMGLGVAGQGIVNPVSVKVLPPNQSLDHAVNSGECEVKDEKRGKKRSRGGRRKHEKKYAAAARAAKDEEKHQPDIFSFINQLAKHGTGSDRKDCGITGQARHTKKEDRQSLIAYDDEVKGLRSRVEKLEEMVNRNQGEKLVFEAASRKLEETRKALAEAEALHASASHALASREKEKRWLKF